jgi:glycoprotein endo-alpha-1,2-mannosidase
MVVTEIKGHSGLELQDFQYELHSQFAYQFASQARNNYINNMNEMPLPGIQKRKKRTLLNGLRMEQRLPVALRFKVRNRLYELLVVASITLLCGFCSFASCHLLFSRPELSNLSKQVWILYLGCWGNPKTDTDWGAWARAKPNDDSSSFAPPDELPSVFTPLLGPYSSHDPSIIKLHLAMIRTCNIDVIVVPWHGVSHFEGNSSFTDQTLKLLFQFAPEYNIKIIPLLPDYSGRNLDTVIADLTYYKQNYIHQRAQVFIHGNPIVIFDASHSLEYNAPVSRLFPEFAPIAITDSFENYMKAFEEGFIGFLAYHGSEFASWSSNTENWPFFAKSARNRGVLLGLGISPGYNDSSVVRWSRRLLQARNCSSFYDGRWKAAIRANASIVFVNSFNNWEEGTVIEPVGQMGLNADTWCDSDLSGDYYLNTTRHWVSIFKKSQLLDPI